VQSGVVNVFVCTLEGVGKEETNRRQYSGEKSKNEVLGGHMDCYIGTLVQLECFETKEGRELSEIGCVRDEEKKIVAESSGGTWAD
jgi:hypothetical protein